MVNINRIPVTWTGFPGGPGVSTFYATNAALMLNGLEMFFTALVDYLPSDVVITLPETGDVIDPVSGELTGTWTEAARDPIAGGAGGAYAAPVGIAYTWHTDTVVHGHRLTGRTFIVPTAGTVFDSDGSIATAWLGALGSAGDLMVSGTGGSFVIWNRPVTASPGPPVREARAGGFSEVISATLSDKAAVLRSRRD